jgi:hypothetical protein
MHWHQNRDVGVLTSIELKSSRHLRRVNAEVCSALERGVTYANRHSVQTWSSAKKNRKKKNGVKKNKNKLLKTQTKKTTQTKQKNSPAAGTLAIQATPGPTWTMVFRRPPAFCGGVAPLLLWLREELLRSRRCD